MMALVSTFQDNLGWLRVWLWWQPINQTTANSPEIYEIIRRTSTINHKRTHSVMTTVSTTAAAAAAVETKSEFPPLTQIQIILIAVFSSAVLLLLFCTIVYQIYKRAKAKQQQKMMENQRHDEVAIGGQHRSARPIIYNICTDVNSTAYLNPSASTTFTVSSSQSTSRFQEYYPT